MPAPVAATSEARAWFVTGCSSGIGYELGKALLERGERVALTARDASRLHDLAAAHRERALVVPLDVTNATQRDAAIAHAERAFGAIDVLVNNAGYGYYAPIEEGEDADVRAMFDTNFFAAVALMQRVLPAMRARRRGCIVNVSSVGGFVAHPGSGFYAATKFALEAVSEALSKEAKHLGVRVLIVEPGPFRTRFLDNSHGERGVRIGDYDESVGTRRRAVQATSGKQSGDPVRAAAAIIDAVDSPAPPLRLVLGAQALAHIRDKMKSFGQEIDAWEATSLGADFPK